MKTLVCLTIGGLVAAVLTWSIPSPPYILLASVSAQDGPVSVQAGVYSLAQAERGEKLFAEACMVCHQPEEFSDGGYMQGWTGQSVRDFVEFIRSTMPEDNPGRLRRSEYIDIVAFLFKQNGLPTGENEMERRTLKDIQIEGPYNQPSQD